MSTETREDEPEVHVGCAGFQGPLGRYFDGVDARELGPRELVARGATLRRWREASPDRARFVPWVDAAVADAQFRGPEAEAGWARLVEAAGLVGADTVLLRTKPSFRPTAENRRALVDFFAPARFGALQVAWWAEGLWGGVPEARDEICAETGLLPVVDPLALDDDEPTPAGDSFYWRVHARRGGGRLSDYDLDALLDLCAGRVAGYVVFGAQTLWADARRFAVLSGATRPRGA